MVGEIHSSGSADGSFPELAEYNRVRWVLRCEEGWMESSFSLFLFRRGVGFWVAPAISRSSGGDGLIVVGSGDRDKRGSRVLGKDCFLLGGAGPAGAQWTTA